MRKHLLISIVFVFVCSLFLMACQQETDSPQDTEGEPGGETVDEQVEGNAQESEGVEISYTNAESEDNPEAYQAQEEFDQGFMGEYSHITLAPDPFEYTPEAYITRVEGGNAPTITMMWLTELAMVTDRGYAADITDLIENWEYSDQVNPGVLQLGEVGGSYYALPIAGYSKGLLYNKNMFIDAGIVDDEGNARPPATWEEFAEAAQLLTDRDQGISGFTILTTNNQGGWNFLNWGWQAGGEFLEQENGQWQAIYNSPEMVEALQFIKDLRWTYDVLQYETIMDADGLFQTLAAEQTAMALYTGDWLAPLQQNGGNLEDWEMAPLPEGPAGPANQTGGSMLVFDSNATPEELEAAFEYATYKHYNTDLSIVRESYESIIASDGLVGSPQFAKWEPGSENQQALDEVTAEMSNIPAENYEAYQETMLDHARPEPPVLAQELYNEMDSFIQAVLVDENADPQALLDESVERFQSQLDDIPE